jgi:hypothetical protein
MKNSRSLLRKKHLNIKTLQLRHPNTDTINSKDCLFHMVKAQKARQRTQTDSNQLYPNHTSKDKGTIKAGHHICYHQIYQRT